MTNSRDPYPILAQCGYRCDLCPAYRENIRGPEDQQRTSDGWFKYYGFRIPPERICCDGCRDDRPEARRIDTSCPVRPCAIGRGLNTCAACSERGGCERFESRTATRASVVHPRIVDDELRRLCPNFAEPRAQELSVLTDPRLREAAGQLDVELVT